MPLSRETAHQASDWFRREAARYVVLAQNHIDQAHLMAEGTDKTPVNPRRRDQFHDMALEATRMAQQFLEFAIAIRLLTMTSVRIEPGDLADVLATFRPPAGRSLSGQPVRATLAADQAANA